MTKNDVKKLQEQIKKLQQENTELKQRIKKCDDNMESSSLEHKSVEETLRHNHELLYKFIQNSPIYTFIKTVTAEESRVVYASENFSDMIGISGSEMVGKNMAELFPMDFAAKITADDWNVVSNGHVIKLDEELEGHYYTTIKFPITIGKKCMLAGYTIDITDRKKNEIIISNQNRELQELNADKDRFIAILAHDLRNPIALLLNISELLHEDLGHYQSSDIEDLIKINYRSARRISALLEDILIWAKAHSGKLPFEPRKIIFSDIFSEIMVSFKNQMERKNLSIKVDSNDDIIVADKNMLSTVLRNLISNAIKFTNFNGCIEVKLKREGTNLVFIIKDNGVGISEEQQKMLWNFSKTNSRKGTDNENGSGLGLIICKELVEKHGGKIWVESCLNKGSHFIFSIPQVDSK